jgi:DNA-binding transcriptional LysR family regulator
MKLDHFSEDSTVEILFDDHLVVVAAKNSVWAGRRRIDLADLGDQPWLLPPEETWTYGFVAKAFRERQLAMPKVSLMTFSLPLVLHFLARGSFIAALPNSVVSLHSETDLLKILPVNFPPSRWPVAIVTLKERTLSPIVERFIECSREVAKSLVGPREGPMRKPAKR